MKEIISTKNAPAAIGPYSQGVKLGDLIFTSGQIPLNPITGEMPESIEEQTKQALENVKAILDAKGLSMDNIIKTTVFMTDLNDFTKMNDIYATYFNGEKPARSAIEISKLPKGAKIEIEAIATM